MTDLKQHRAPESLPPLEPTPSVRGETGSAHHTAPHPKDTSIHVSLGRPAQTQAILLLSHYRATRPLSAGALLRRLLPRSIPAPHITQHRLKCSVTFKRMGRETCRRGERGGEGGSIRRSVMLALGMNEF